MRIAPRCRFCGELIAKKTTSVWIEPTSSGLCRDVNIPFMRAVFTDDAPTTKAECAKFTNKQVVSVVRSADRKRISRFSEWDGESYVSEFFCSTKHAQEFGYLMAHIGCATKKWRNATEKGER